MNSQQRVLAAAERRRPDRPATSARFTSEALELMRAHLGVPASDNTLNDVLDVLDSDIRWVAAPFIGPEERSTGTLAGVGTDFWGVGHSKISNPSNTYYEFSYHPLAEADCVADIENYDWPELDWWDYDALPDQIARANATDRRAILLFAGGCFETPWYLRGLEQFLIDLHTQPEIAEAICRRVFDYYMARTMRALDVVGDRVDMILSGGDIGEQQRMLIDPEVWRQRIKPFTGPLISTFKQRGYMTIYHTDGSVLPVIDDFIELGLDFLDPVQVSARGMRPDQLHARFGDRLSFHGGIDEQELLPVATADEVYDVTTRTIDVLGHRGGYVASPTHCVQGDTPPENVVAIFDAAKDYRWS